MTTSLPDALMKQHVADLGELHINQSVSFPEKMLPNATGLITAASGTRNDVPAAILDLRMREDSRKPAFIKQEDILCWFDNAHSAIRSVYQSLIKEELKEKIGPTRKVIKK
jgi:uncharacterized protein (TIGR04255 family)